MEHQVVHGGLFVLVQLLHERLGRGENVRRVKDAPHRGAAGAAGQFIIILGRSVQLLRALEQIFERRDRWVEWGKLVSGRAHGESSSSDLNRT